MKKGVRHPSAFVCATASGTPVATARTRERACACAGAAALLWVCLLTSGGCERRSAEGGVHLHVVTPIAEQNVSLSLYGLVANYEPEGYQPPMPWLPVDELVPEGSEVEAGDQLLGLNLAVAEMWSEVRQLDIREVETRLRLERLQTAQGIAVLDVRRRDLEQEGEVIDARAFAIEDQRASRIHDEEVVEVLALGRQQRRVHDPFVPELIEVVGHQALKERLPVGTAKRKRAAVFEHRVSWLDHAGLPVAASIIDQIAVGRNRDAVPINRESH